MIASPTTADGMTTPDVNITAGYRRYMLWLMMLVYALNLLDRQIVTILGEPIKRDLQLADWQLGAVTGLAFALFYTFLGIPLARLADRANRVWIIAGALAVWSGFTMVCGLARTFPQLLLARIGVAVGEAGGLPPSHSLITECTPKEKRASAMAFYSLGIPLGSIIGLTFGGILAGALGWRTAFFLAGAPGLLLALVVLFTIKEPRREAGGAMAKQDVIPFGEALRELKPSFWWTAFGGGFAAFVFYAQSAFYGSFFLRNHTAELARLAEQFGMSPIGLLGTGLGLCIGVGSAIGTYAGGVLADRARRGGISGYSKVCALASLIAAPFFAAVALPGDPILAMVMLFPAIVLYSMNFGPIFAAGQSVVRPRARATAAAVLIFIINIVGLGVGPLALGALSDGLAASMGEAAGLKWAMSAAAVMLILAAGMFYQASKTIARDEVA